MKFFNPWAVIFNRIPYRRSTLSDKCIENVLKIILIDWISTQLYIKLSTLCIHCVSADSPFIQEPGQPQEHPPCPLCLSRQSIYTRVSTTTGTPSLSIVSQQTVHLCTEEAEELL